MLITAAMIVRNEEAFLENCLESLRGVVDEVVIVDTGSEDRSKEIAAAHAARVVDLPWKDDFAAARNHALELARGEWILYIDADERVRAGSAEGLRSRLAGPELLGEHVWLRPRPELTDYRVLRLFRNHPAVRFEGVIHETIWPSLLRHRSRAGGDFGFGDLALDHFGYEGDQTRKHRRNLPLLIRAVKEDPLRIYAWNHLAETYAATGFDALAVESWERAIGIVRKNGNSLADAPLVFIGLLQFERDRGNDITELLQEARQRFPEDLQLLWMEGEARMKARQYEKAIRCFEQLLPWEGSERLELPVAYNRGMFDLHAYGALAACYFGLKDYANSSRYYELALSRDPDSREFRVKHALCSRLQRGVA